MASSVRAEMKRSGSSAACLRMVTYSSTMYSDTSAGTEGSNWRVCEIIARMNAESRVSY